MLIAEMLNATKEFLNNSSRYSDTSILRRLNLMQQEMLSELPPEQLTPFAKYDVKFVPEVTPTNNFELPSDFLFHISVKGDQTPIQFLSSETPNTFPYGGTSYQPVIRQDGSKGIFYGRLHDQTIWLSYYRMPREMKINGLDDLSGAEYSGDNVECELPANLHWKLCYRAARSFRLMDGDLQETQGDVK